MGHTQLLAGCELFSSLTPEAVEGMAASSRTVSLARNSVLFAEGDDAADLYLVQRGRVAIVKGAADGRESVVALMERGDVFGEVSLFDGGGRSAGAKAIEPSELVAVPFEVARRAMADDPRALWAVLALLASRLRSADDMLAASVFLDVPGRTARRLLELAPGEGFSRPVTQEELAA
ncbi:MAG: Crp/Fnr family transcriptional regulator, partial [Acidimicrobiales bacterium]